MVCAALCESCCVCTPVGKPPTPLKYSEFSLHMLIWIQGLCCDQVLHADLLKRDTVCFVSVYRTPKHSHFFYMAQIITQLATVLDKV